MKVTSSRFERSAFRPEDEPPALGPLVLFLGRSNVGKSSLINRLLGAKGLARTSRLPGRTQSINFYQVNGWFYFVDLPGYGYSSAPQHVRRSWGPMVQGFLERRSGLIALAVLLLDLRHRPSALDCTMCRWVEAMRVPYAIAAAKADKLSASARARAAVTLVDGLGPPRPPEQAIVVSSESGLGLGELWRRVESALARAAEDAGGALRR